MSVTEIVDARKNVLKADDAWQIFEKAEKVYVGRGKKTVEFSPESASQEALLKVSLGRTGNLRAPTVRKGKTVYVGYNETMYRELAG